MVQPLIDFFNHPFFIIVGGIATIASLIVVLYTLFLVIKGVLPVWYRLGLGLSKREIMIFADDEYDDIKNMLVDSKIFQESNIKKIDKTAIKKAEQATLLLVHWKSFGSNIESILNIKKDAAALIVYAPQDQGKIDRKTLEMINKERNSIIVNLRGRLLNDILVCMITTSYEKE
jgi:hypothetical protein